MPIFPGCPRQTRGWLLSTACPPPIWPPVPPPRSSAPSSPMAALSPARPPRTAVATVVCPLVFAAIPSQTPTGGRRPARRWPWRWTAPRWMNPRGTIWTRRRRRQRRRRDGFPHPLTALAASRPAMRSGWTRPAVENWAAPISSVGAGAAPLCPGWRSHFPSYILLRRHVRFSCRNMLCVIVRNLWSAWRTAGCCIGILKM